MNHQARRPTSTTPLNLPIPTTPVIGRAREIAAVVDLLRQPSVRLLTLSGPPGVGKTRLALAAAAAVDNEFLSGAVFVDLSAVRTPDLLHDALVQSLGVRRFPGLPPLQRLARHLADQHVLLVLDNFEQVIATGSSVATLLESCARLKVLITSREALRLRAEHEFLVAPLAVPDLQVPSKVETLSGAPAVALFVARAKAMQPGFVLGADNALAVAEICIRLDGLPLAIELAAARIKVLPPNAMLSRLAQRLPLLVTGARDLPERHQTLRTAITWSEDLLDAAERRAFRRLAVFAGGFTLEAAQATAGDPGTDSLDIVTTLVNKSLVRREVASSVEPRFAMLETIREHAWERLVAAGESDEARDGHLRYFLDLAERSKTLFNSGQAPTWLAVMEQEYDNFRTALAWAAERTNVDSELRLGSAICRFWSLRGNVGEGYRWLDAALAKSREAPPRLRAKLLHGKAALVRQMQGDQERAILLDQEGLAIARNTGDRDTELRCLLNLGHAHVLKAPATAKALYAECLSLARVVEDRFVVGGVVQGLAVMAGANGDVVRAARLHGAAEAIMEAHGLPYSPYAVTDKTALGRSIVGVVIRLGRAAFGSAWAEGRRLPPEVVVDYALGRLAIPAPAVRVTDPRTETNLLTAREREVARLVAGGLSNREIGKTLVISERTVDAHVQHILNKLGFNSRAQIAAWIAASSPTAERPATPA